MLKVILYLDPSGAKTSVPLLPTVKPFKSLLVTFLIILYLSFGAFGSCVLNFVGLTRFPASSSAVINLLIVESSTLIGGTSSANFLEI